MGIFNGERAANDGVAEAIFEDLKRMLFASRNEISLLGVRDEDAQEVYERGQRLLKNEIGNRRKGTSQSS
ncbi:hypothetical protein EPO56_02875 [Patescibacteria group bacterium]|nr:MAG: hypothetical protein EPO56_02875 [Patescibacteria group bacterium]